MKKQNPAPCAKCGECPEVQDKRIRFVVICDCETPTNYVFGNSVGFLDHIENEEAAQIALDAVNVNELKLTAIEAWNREQELLRLRGERDELIEYVKQELLKSTSVIFRPHLEGAFVVIEGRIARGEKIKGEDNE